MTDDTKLASWAENEALEKSRKELLTENDRLHQRCEKLQMEITNGFIVVTQPDPEAEQKLKRLESWVGEWKKQLQKLGVTPGQAYYEITEARQRAAMLEGDAERLRSQLAAKDEAFRRVIMDAELLYDVLWPDGGREDDVPAATKMRQVLAERDERIERLVGALRSITRHGEMCDCGPQRAYGIARAALEAEKEEG